MKNQNTIYWIIGIIIVLLVVANYQPKQEMVELTPHFYKDGVEVFPTRGLFSIITPPGDFFDQIAFSISSINTGNVPIDLQIVNASPIELLNALPLTTQTLEIGESTILWTSGLMDAVQFENMIQPVNFWVQISGESEFLETSYEEFSVPLVFEPELPSLVVDTSIILGGYQEYSSILITSLGVINVDPTIGWLNLTATKSIEVQGKIDGYSKSNNKQGKGGYSVSPTKDGVSGGLGGEGASGGSGGKRGDYAKRGAGGSGGSGSPIVGTETGRYELISGGGAGGGGSGGSGYGCGSSQAGYPSLGGDYSGGAAIRLESPVINISGEISVSGRNGGYGGKGGDARNCGAQAGGGGGGGGGGGAAAGMIILNGQTIDISNSNMLLVGGSGGPGGAGGPSIQYNGYAGKAGGTGSGGRLKVFYTDEFLNEGMVLSLGSGGTSYINQVPY